jgi:VWFA-related protein
MPVRFRPYDRPFAFVAVMLALLAGPAVPRAQTPQGAPPPAPASGTAPQRFATGTTAIVVDVVVRDRKGAPITDLTPADFELLEDGVKQEVSSVELVSVDDRGQTIVRPAGTPAAETRANPSVVPGPTVVALVFHRLSPEGRALAHRAALAYLENGPRPTDFAGVFMIDQGLSTVQTYTTDQKRLKAAIDDAAGRISSVYASQSMGANGAAAGDASPGLSPTASAESAGRRDASNGVLGAASNEIRSGDAAVQVVADRMERSFADMMRDRDGHAETAALTALVSSLSLLPGRKTVVFFSEGLSVTTAVEAKFRGLFENLEPASRLAASIPL